MNNFAIPGYMALGDFVERAGKAILADEWLGAAAVAAELELRQEIMDNHHRVRIECLGKGRAAPAVVPLPQWLSEKSRATSEAARWRRAQYEEVIARIRTAFCVGEIGAGRLELLTGDIVAIPANFWRSQVADAVFINDTPWLVAEPDPVAPVLLASPEAEAWLASLAPDATAAKADPIDWFRAEIEAGNRRTRGEMCAELQKRFRLSERKSLQLWAQEAPECWKKSGRPKSPH